MSETLGKWGHLLLNALGLLALLAIVEVLIYQHNVRIDFTPEGKFTLSPHAEQILDDLEHDVKVLVFTRDDDPRNGQLRDLLWRVRARQPRVSYDIVDVNRNPALARRYNADAYGLAVVESGGRRKTFSNIKEEILMAAVLQVTRAERKKIYFLEGHGEKDIGETDRRRGYSTASRVLQDEFYEAASLSLLGAKAVPDDATVVVIAGPRQDLLPDELLSLGDYLNRGGALLVLLDPGSSPSLVAFLERYGIEMPDEVVADATYSMAQGEPLTARMPGVSSHSLVTSTLDSDPVFSFSRPVETAASLDTERRVLVRTLLETSNRSWSIPAPGGDVPSDAYDFVAARDRKGPIAVGAELVLPIEGRDQDPEEVEPDEDDTVARQVSRMIVYGDADFANNFFIELLGNRDLFVNSVNFLAREDRLIAVRPKRKAVGREQFYVSARQSYWAFLLSTIIEPSAFLLLGAGVFFWRRIR